MSQSQSKRRSRLFRGGIVVATIATTVIASATPASAAAVTVTLNTANGPSGVTSTITASHTTAWLAGVAAPVATLSLPACQTTYNTTADTEVTPSTTSIGNIKTGVTATKITNYKAFIALPTIPQSPPATATTTKYNVCVYSGSVVGTDVLLGSATYTVAAPAAIDGTTPVTPDTGPALGGTLITVLGTGFPTTASGITATLGGSPLTNITPVSSTKFTAVTPYHASGAVPLAVTTSAGTATKQSAFTYANGINISPNTASSAGSVYIDVVGSGFQAYGTFGTTGLSANRAATPGPRVLLVDGVFNALISTGDYTNGPTAECGSVAVISDSELICSINLLTGRLTPGTAAALGTPVLDGTYTLTVTTNAKTSTAPVLGISTDLSSGSTFTVADY